MKRLLRGVLTRTFFAAVLALLQVGLTIGLFLWVGSLAPYVYLVLIVLSILFILALLDRDNVNPAYKIMWILLIVSLPPTGSLFYLFWAKPRHRGRKALRYAQCEARGRRACPVDEELLRRLREHSPAMGRCARYLADYAGAPVYSDTSSRYFAWGEDFFPVFLEQLRAAKRFVFMEYFIINPGYMWDTTLSVLKEKAAQGLDVRVMYDAVGCMFTLPEDYDQVLRSYGIKCVVFSPLEVSRRISDYRMFNHRDHRKIAVIDGNVGFTGGLNFADEYINRKKRFGVWKDTGLMLQGSGVYSLTCTFLNNWDYCTGAASHHEDYAPQLRCPADGYVQPYADNPLDQENISENAYFNILHQSQNYAYIVTPYLVIDSEMISSLKLAAKSGVDVRIITPGIPDKWYVYWVTQSFYRTLLEAGVRIYEYTPGFIHAKMYVSDDRMAIVGSANMDYRSLYLHFENCCAFYGGKMVQDVRRDIERCMTQSREVTLEDVDHTPWPKRLFQLFLRLFAPLL